MEQEIERQTAKQAGAKHTERVCASNSGVQLSSIPKPLTGGTCGAQRRARDLVEDSKHFQPRNQERVSERVYG